METLELFFSISSPTFFMALLVGGVCLGKKRETGVFQSEIFSSSLKELLQEAKRKLSEVEKVYLTTGPGSQAAIRVSLTFVMTLQTLSPKIKIYHLNTLLLQAADNRCISCVSRDKSGRQFHVAVYQDTRELLSPQLRNKEELELIKGKHLSFTFLQNLETIDFLHNFQQLRNSFVPLTDREIGEIKRKYL